LNKDIPAGYLIAVLLAALYAQGGFEVVKIDHAAVYQQLADTFIDKAFF
jgi:hypothetical protein